MSDREEKKADAASTFGMRFGADAQRVEWEAHVVVSLAKNVCPYSGLEGPECKSWLCDCFQFEDLWGVSQK